MKKALSIIAALALTASFLGGCSKTEGKTAYKDGTYKAIYERYDVRNWKAFVELTVKDGKITDAKYDYTNDNGDIRSDDPKYSDGFKGANKVTPKEAFAELSKRLIKAQNAEKVDAFTGATHSSKNFKQLSSEALKQAEKGNQTEVKVPLYKDGTYKVEYDKFDSHGWKAQLELEIKDDKIQSTKFDYVNKDGKLKTQDAEYKKNMEATSKTYPEKAIDELTTQLIDKQVISTVDAVTGATSTSNDFSTLVEYALDDMAENGKTEPAKIPAPAEEKK